MSEIDDILSDHEEDQDRAWDESPTDGDKTPDTIKFLNQFRYVENWEDLLYFDHELWDLSTTGVRDIIFWFAFDHSLDKGTIFFRGNIKLIRKWYPSKEEKEYKWKINKNRKNPEIIKSYEQIKKSKGAVIANLEFYGTRPKNYWENKNFCKFENWKEKPAPFILYNNKKLWYEWVNYDALNYKILPSKDFEVRHEHCPGWLYSPEKKKTIVHWINITIRDKDANYKTKEKIKLPTKFLDCPKGFEAWESHYPPWVCHICGAVLDNKHNKGRPRKLCTRSFCHFLYKQIENQENRIAKREKKFKLLDLFQQNIQEYYFDDLTRRSIPRVKVQDGPLNSMWIPEKGWYHCADGTDLTLSMDTWLWDKEINYPIFTPGNCDSCIDHKKKRLRKNSFICTKCPRKEIYQDLYLGDKLKNFPYKKGSGIGKYKDKPYRPRSKKSKKEKIRFVCIDPSLYNEDGSPRTCKTCIKYEYCRSMKEREYRNMFKKKERQDKKTYNKRREQQEKKDYANDYH